MPVKTETTWTCSRCGRIDSGATLDLPDGWRHFAYPETTGFADLCDRCVDEYQRFLDGAILVPFNTKVTTDGVEVDIPGLLRTLGALLTRISVRDAIVIDAEELLSRYGTLMVNS